VIFDLAQSFPIAEFITKLDSQGVKVIRFGNHRLRAVTHRMVSADDIDYALSQIEHVCRELRQS
jgi:threonine aldolase